MAINRILLTENDPIIAAHLCLALEAKGYLVELCEADNIKLRIAEHVSPYILLANAKTIGELSKELNGQAPNLSHIKGVLVITGMRDIDLPDFNCDAPAYKILFKPFTRIQLFTAVKNTLAASFEAPTF